MSSGARKFKTSLESRPGTCGAQRLHGLSAMSKGLKKRIRECTDPSDFADRLHEIAAQIERDFDGRERDRLLELVRETLERHLEIRENTQRAREALEQLQSDHRALLRLFDFITARPESTTVH